MVANASRQIETAKWAILPRADARAGEGKSATVSFWLDADDSITVSCLSTHELLGFYDQEQSEVASVDQSNQQYSILALTDSSGNVSERYAYTAYGQPTFLNASATVQTSSAAGNRYTYTAREWDETLGLHHFRARWMSGPTRGFLNRDPSGFRGSKWGLYVYAKTNPMRYVDWDGKEPQDSNAGIAQRSTECTAAEVALIDSAKQLAKDRLRRNPGCFQQMRVGQACLADLQDCIGQALDRMSFKCAAIGNGLCHEGRPTPMAHTESECSKLKSDAADGLIYPAPGFEGPPCKVDPCKHPLDFANNCKLCPGGGPYEQITTWLCRGSTGNQIEPDVEKLAELLVHEASHNCVGGHLTTNLGPPGAKTDACRRPDSGDIENVFKGCR